MAGCEGEDIFAESNITGRFLMNRGDSACPPVAPLRFRIVLYYRFSKILPT